MSFHRPTRLELAVHEAGHAYAFAALVRCGEPEEMGLATKPDGSHHGWNRRGTILLREVDFAKVPPDARPSMTWQAEVETAIAIAGPLAEFRHRLRSRDGAAILAFRNAEAFLRPNAFDTDGDFDRIRRSLSHVATPDPLATLQTMVDVSDQILNANWPKVRALSRLLLTRGRLDEDEPGLAKPSSTAYSVSSCGSRVPSSWMDEYLCPSRKTLSGLALQILPDRTDRTNRRPSVDVKFASRNRGTKWWRFGAGMPREVASGANPRNVGSGGHVRVEP